MLIHSAGQWRWQVGNTMVHAAVFAGFCTYIVFAGPVAAAAPKEKPAQRQGWKRAGMGVTAVVLPTCAVRVGSRPAANSQPIMIRCTRNTEYAFSARAASGAVMTVELISEDAEPLTDGPGRVGRYIVTRVAAGKAAGEMFGGAGLLSIDF